MTPEWCVGKCKLAGYSYAGLQYGYLCFCGDKFGKYGRADDRDCDSLCFGDKTRNCGSFWHNSIFAVGEDFLKTTSLKKERRNHCVLKDILESYDVGTWNGLRTDN